MGAAVKIGIGIPAAVAEEEQKRRRRRRRRRWCWWWRNMVDERLLICIASYKIMAGWKMTIEQESNS